MPREQAGSGEAGGPEDRGRDSGGERLNDWQRVEAEKPDRDRAMKAWDASHGPTPEFEQAGRAVDPEVKRARPERIEPGDLTAEQRADLEAMSGQSIEHMLERRNEARAQETAGTEPERPPMDLRADLPDDDVYNHVIGAYNRGEIPYGDAVARLEYLDASPVHGKPLDTGDDRDAAAENTADAGEAADAAGGSGRDDGGSGHSEALASPPDDPGGHQAYGEAAATGADTVAETPRPENFSMQPPDAAGMYVRLRIDEHGQPDWSTATHADTGEPLQPDHVGGAERPASEEAAVESGSVTQAPSEHPVEASPTDENTTPSYDSPTDIREELLSGRSVPEVRREFTEQLDEDPPEEPTADLVREDDEHRYEKGTPQELPEPLAASDPEGVREALRRPENIKNVQQALDYWGKWVESFDLDDPTSATVRTPPEQSAQRGADQVAYASVPSERLAPTSDAQDPGAGGAAVLWTAPLVGYLMVDQAARWASAKISERRATE